MEAKIGLLLGMLMFSMAAAKMAGNLRVTVYGANNLPREDLWPDQSDPFVRVEAFRPGGTSAVLETDTKWGTTDPVYDQVLEFGDGKWDRIVMQAIDEDLLLDKDDDLTEPRQIVLKAEKEGKKFTKKDRDEEDSPSVTVSFEVV